MLKKRIKGYPPPTEAGDILFAVQSSAFNKQRQFEELLSFSRRLNSY